MQVIVDGEAWAESLPSIISAVVMVDTESDTSTSKQAWQFTRRAHLEFLRTFQLNAASFPLVLYDVAASPRPFRLLDNT